MNIKQLVFVASMVGISLGSVLGSGTHTISVVNAGESEAVISTPVATPMVSTAVGTREVSSYTLGRTQETDDSPCIGAFNDNLCELAKQGIRTCASNEFKKGTTLVVGDGLECVVLDRMNPRYTTRIDIADLDYEAARRFGVQTLQIRIVNKP